MVKTQKILVTGASGFIGSAMADNLALSFEVFALDSVIAENPESSYVQFKGDILDQNFIEKLCDEHRFDVVIHCAGIAHQKAGRVGREQYMKVNCEATLHLAQSAAKTNEDLIFIFLSTISVYGEQGLSRPVKESDPCMPSSDYAFSKLKAEEQLKIMSENSTIKHLDILRLAPVYNRTNSFNLDKRVFAPMKLAYIKYGSGEQKMSALARRNLIDFLKYRLDHGKVKSDSSDHVFNLCDDKPYTFNEIIKVFKSSGLRPARPTFTVPMTFVKTMIKAAAFVFTSKKDWLLSCYDKLALDLVFDSRELTKTGFQPKNSLETIFKK